MLRYVSNGHNITFDTIYTIEPFSQKKQTTVEKNTHTHVKLNDQKIQKNEGIPHIFLVH